MVIQEIGNSSKRLARDLCMKSISKICTLDILPSMQILGSDTSAGVKALTQTTPFFFESRNSFLLTQVICKSDE